MRFNILQLFFTLLVLQLALANNAYFIKVVNPSTSSLTNFQLRVRLPEELIGKNIVILDVNKSPIPFCYENLVGECSSEPTLGDGFIWIKVPHIDPNETMYLYLLEFDKGVATDPSEVFDYYNDFSNPSALSNWFISNFTIVMKSDYCYATLNGFLASLNHIGISSAIAKLSLNLSSNSSYIVEVRAALSSAKFVGWLFIRSNDQSIDLTGTQPWQIYTLGPLEAPLNITFEYYKSQGDVEGCDRAYIDFIRVRKYSPSSPSVTIIPIPEDVLLPITTLTSTKSTSNSYFTATVPAPSMVVLILPRVIKSILSSTKRKMTTS